MQTREEPLAWRCGHQYPIVVEGTPMLLVVARSARAIGEMAGVTALSLA